MIERINLASVNTNSTPPQKSKPQFTGLVDGLVKTVQVFEQNPMANVTFLDVTTAIGPRTIYESQTNGFAGFEAFRRESSGLIVNCLIPGAIVWGAANLLQAPIMGAGSTMASSWADEDTIKTVAKYFKAAEGEGEVKVRNTYINMTKDLYGKDGDENVLFKDFNHDKSIKKLTDATVRPTKYSEKQVKKAIELIAQQTHVTEHVNIGHGEGKYTGKLSAIIGEAPTIIKELLKPKNADIEKFIKKSTKLVTAKSLMGLGIVIPLAISMQPINRWITAKTSGKKGAPIYRDYATSKPKELTAKEKADLFSHKLVSASAMVGVALLSVMKKPSVAMLKKITQFNGIFPTMDQARIISTATFASRMMASEDKNDLREATVRDIATFSAFYFLGDYVAKGIATLMPKYKLINRLEGFDKNTTGLKKFWNWAKNTSLKSSDEIASAAGKKMRSVCQLGNIGFSLVALGFLIPMITRTKTDKQHEEDLKKSGVDEATIEKFYPHLMMNSPAHAKKGNVYQAFFTAK